MPRSLASYSREDWLRLRPLTQSYKEAVYRFEDRLFSARPPASPTAFAAACSSLAGRALAITIAFNSDRAIAWQARFCRRNLRGAALVVVDNSTDEAAAARIATVCRDASVAYVRLRHGPTDPRSASRSHGVALNWAYRRLVRRLEPPVFAFIDHDCFPIQPVDLAALVADQPIYGQIQTRANGWYLWPGFSVFRWSAVAHRRLDFRQDWFLGLDTGGANWRRLYRELDRDRLRFARAWHVEFRDPASARSAIFHRVDDWIHIGNMSGWMAPEPGRDELAATLLARAEADPAGTLATLIPQPTAPTGNRVAGDDSRRQRAAGSSAGPRPD